MEYLIMKKDQNLQFTYCYKREDDDKIVEQNPKSIYFCNLNGLFEMDSSSYVDIRFEIEKNGGIVALRE